jgi:hypothetical protein
MAVKSNCILIISDFNYFLKTKRIAKHSQKNTARKPCFFIASCSLSPKAKQEDAMVFFDFIDGGGTERTRNPAAISATFNLMIKKRGVFGSNYD